MTERTDCSPTPFFAVAGFFFPMMEGFISENGQHNQKKVNKNFLLDYSREHNFSAQGSLEHGDRSHGQQWPEKYHAGKAWGKARGHTFTQSIRLSAQECVESVHVNIHAVLILQTVPMSYINK